MTRRHHSDPIRLTGLDAWIEREPHWGDPPPDPILRRAAGERCVDGTLYRHNPSRDDPYYEHNLGRCPDCGGEGRNCTDCAAEHAEERWEMRTHGERVVVLHLCADCADRRRDAMAEVTP